MVTVEAMLAVVGLAWTGLVGWATIHLGRIVKTLQEIVDRIDKIEDDEMAHRRAGVAYARALHRDLDRQRVDSPDPDDFPGM